MIQPYRIQQIEPLHDAGWVKLFRLIYERAGQTFSWIFASRKAAPQTSTEVDAVLIVARVRGADGRVRTMLIREVRPVIWDGEDALLHAFPSGLKDPGESIEACARRELFEETGLNLVRIHWVSPRLFFSAGLTDESCVLVCCDAEGEPTLDHLEGAENLELLLVEDEEWKRLVWDPRLKWSAQTWPFVVLLSQGASPSGPS